MLSRLRLAVELDCDARVIGAGTAPQIYGNLLIDVATLHAGHRVPALALLNPPSNLQRRLTAMRPQSIRFARLRLTAAGIAALGALIVACQAELPTDQSVASLDAVKTERMARLMADTILFKVDGKVVDAVYARSLKSEDIESTKIEHGGRARGGAGDPTMVAFTTTPGSATRQEMLRSKVELDRARSAPQSDSMRVLSDVHEILAPTMLRVTGSPKEFHGLVFIDGKRADRSALERLDHAHIKSVEIVKGASASKLYKDPAAAFGVIAIVTK
jgi:hypothetical protein